MTIPVGKIILRVHPLLPIIWLFSLLLGGASLLPMLAALTLHECGHIGMAYLLRMPVEEIEITPFGGVMKIRGIEDAPPLSVFLIAAGGPIASLLCCLAAPVICSVVGFSFAQAFARIGLLMLLINLLPALPLDGGRMLRAVLTHFLPYAAATRWLIREGYFGGACLCGLSLFFAFQGHLVFAPVFAGLYLMYAATVEKRQGSSRYVTALIARRQKIEQGILLPVELIAAGEDTPLYRLLPVLSSRKYHQIYVLSPDGMDCAGVINDQKFCESLLQDPHQPLKNCIKKTAGA